ncbi:MAG: hypothetical protein RSA01_01480 [Clostridium sp.]|uniref:hypothetical protein n=1 Tax=Clostridium sp. TaxID=1506 RepID=UPI002FC7E002
MNINFKSKKSIICLSIISIIFIGIIVTKVYSNIVYNKLEIYLTEKRKYSLDEIQDMNVFYSLGAHIMGYHQWKISVTFKDEPGAIYYYIYNNNTIEPGGVSGTLDDGIWDHSDDPYNLNTRIAGQYVKSKSYRIYKLLGESDKFTLTEDTLKDNNQKSIWNVQNIKPTDYLNKDISVVGFKVRNHPLQSINEGSPEGCEVYVLICDNKAIGGYTKIKVNNKTKIYSIDGKL